MNNIIDKMKFIADMEAKTKEYENELKQFISLQLDEHARLNMNYNWYFSSYRDGIITIDNTYYIGCGDYKTVYYNIPEKKFDNVMSNPKLLEKYKED